jgi:hypothetical protein
MGKRPTTKEELVRKAIEVFEQKLGEKNVTVAEFVKLLELQKEMDGKPPKEIKVTWVEKGKAKPRSKK